MSSTNVAADTQELKWDHVNVTLLDDTIYTDVSVEWKLEGYSIELTQWDGVSINLAPTLIEKITDHDGVDITDEIARLSPAADANFSLLGDGKTIPFRFKFMVLAGLSAALTNTDDSHLPVGAGFVATRLSLSEKIHLGVFYRRQQVIESASAAGGTFSIGANEIHFMLGMRMTHPRRNNNYGYMEAGVIVVDFDQRYNNEIPGWTNVGTLDTGFVVQGGVVIPIKGNFGIDLNGILEYRPSLISNASESGLLIGLNVALAYFN